MPIDLVKIILEGTSELVTTKGGTEEGVGGGQSLTLQDAGNLGLKLLVGDGTREVGLYELVECGILLGLVRHELGNTLRGTVHHQYLIKSTRIQLDTRQ